MIEYNEFMAFELLDDGTKNELDTSPEELGSILDPNQVFVIVREDLRRIFIWKGSKSPVRKRFISSRVAQELQNELIKSAGFHRCIIKSIDQGDELVEFLNAFGLESMEVTERLPDMRYIRNIERDGMAQGIIMDATPVSKKKESTDYYSPALGSFDGNTMESALVSPGIKPQTPKKEIFKPIPITPSSISPGYITRKPSFSQDQVKKILNEILKNDIPDGYKRQNIIMGNYLYGAVSKITTVLGKEVEDTEWERIKKFPNEVIELENNKIRVHIDEKRAIIKGIEVLTLDKKTPIRSKKIATRTPAKKTTTKTPAKKTTTRTPAKKTTTRTPAKKTTSRAPAKKTTTRTTSKKVTSKTSSKKKDTLGTTKDNQIKPKMIKVTGRTLPKIPNADDE